MIIPLQREVLHKSVLQTKGISRELIALHFLAFNLSAESSTSAKEPPLLSATGSELADVKPTKAKSKEKAKVKHRRAREHDESASESSDERPSNARRQARRKRPVSSSPRPPLRRTSRTKCEGFIDSFSFISNNFTCL